MEEIIKKCKCGVFLTVNEHRDFYMSIEDRINTLLKQNRINEGDITSELKERMIAIDEIYELQFYPHTPIGSYTVWGASLDEVIKQALEILK